MSARAPFTRAGSSIGSPRTDQGWPERMGGTRRMRLRYSFGGDEHIFVEVDEEMSLEAFFKSLSLTNAVRDAGIKGVTEICPANASLQVKFDPDVISPDDMLVELKRLETAAD